MALPDVYDALAVDTGPVGDLARSYLEDPPQPGENLADTQVRTARQAGASARIRVMKGKDLAAKGIPSYSSPSGEVKPITDDTGSPLNALDVRHKIAYDSAGDPKKIEFDDAGSPVLKDPYEGLQPKTDPKTGHQYAVAPGLPWRWVGTDEETAQKAEFSRQDKLLTKASTTLGRKLSLDEHDALLHKKAMKDAHGQLKQLGVDSTDPLTGEPLEYDALVAGINGRFDDLRKTDPGATAKSYFGLGDFTPEALKAQSDLDLQRTAALRAAATGHAHAQTLAQIRAKTEAARAQRAEIERVKIAREIESLRAQGIDLLPPEPPVPQLDTPVAVQPEPGSNPATGMALAKNAAGAVEGVQSEGFAGDIGRSVAVGGFSLLKMAGDLYGLATGDMENWASDLGKSGAANVRGNMSDEQLALVAEREKAVKAAPDELGKAWEFVKHTLASPRLLVGLAAENAPNIVGTGGVGLVAKNVAAKSLLKNAATEAAQKLAMKKAVGIGVGAAVGTGAAMQGADLGGDQYDDLISRLDTMPAAESAQIPEIAALMDRGATLDEAKLSLALTQARKTGVLAAAISLASQKLPGAQTIEKALVGGAAGKGVVRSAVRGALGEAGQEMAEEGGGKVASNVLAQPVDPSRPVTQGLGETMATAALAAGPTGAVVGGLNSERAETPVAPPAPETATETEAPETPATPTASTPVEETKPETKPETTSTAPEPGTTNIGDQFGGVLDRVSTVPESAKPSPEGGESLQPESPSPQTAAVPPPSPPSLVEEDAKNMTAQLQEKAPALIAKITDLHADGLTAGEIAKKLNVDDTLVRKVRRGLNLPDQGRGSSVMGIPMPDDAVQAVRFKKWAAEHKAAKTSPTPPKPGDVPAENSAPSAGEAVAPAGSSSQVAEASRAAQKRKQLVASVGDKAESDAAPGDEYNAVHSAIQDIQGEVDLPEGWRVKSIDGSGKSHSVYYTFENPDGEEVFARVADHGRPQSASGKREPDISIVTEPTGDKGGHWKFKSRPSDWARAMDRLERKVREIHEPAAPQPEEKATAAPLAESGGAGFKTSEPGAPTRAGDVRMADRATEATSLPVRGEAMSAEDGVNQKKPTAAPDARPESEKSEHRKKLTGAANVAMRGHAKELKNLGHIARVHEAVLPVGNKSGIATHEGRITIDAAKLDEATRHLSPEQRAAFIKAAVAEEVIHLPFHGFITESPDNLARALKLREDEPAAVEFLKANYPGYDNLSDRQQAAEIARVIMQGKVSPESVTESTWKLIADLIAHIKRILGNMTAETRKVIADIEARMEGVTKAKKPKAEKPKKPGAEPSVWEKVGVNSSGNEVWKDQRGVYSYTEGNFRFTQPVGIIPGGGFSVDAPEGPYKVVDTAPVTPPNGDHKKPWTLSQTLRDHVLATPEVRNALANTPGTALTEIEAQLKKRLGEIARGIAAEQIGDYNRINTPEGRANLTERIRSYAARHPEKVASEEKSEEKPTEFSTPSMQLADWVSAALADGRTLSSQQLFDQADVIFGGTQAAGKYTSKDAFDALEVGVNLHIASGIIQHGAVTSDNLFKERHTVNELMKLLARLPTQGKRTAEQDEYQQFSTPPPFAYAAAWVANLRPSDVMAETSAGTASLAIWGKIAGVKKILMNEFSSRRAELLRSLNLGTVTEENAENINAVWPKDFRPTVAVINPPFSSTAGRVQGERSSMNGAKHLESLLERLPEGGRLVAIVGEGMKMVGGDTSPTNGRRETTGAAFDEWWKRIQAKYNVRANIGVSGKNYAKYGTTFDNQIVVIDKSGPTTEPPVTGKVESVAELFPLLEKIRNDRPESKPSELDQPAETPAGGSSDGSGTAAGSATRPDGPRNRPTGAGGGNVAAPGGTGKPPAGKGDATAGGNKPRPGNAGGQPKGGGNDSAGKPPASGAVRPPVTGPKFTAEQQAAIDAAREAGGDLFGAAAPESGKFDDRIPPEKIGALLPTIVRLAQNFRTPEEFAVAVQALGPKAPALTQSLWQIAHATGAKGDANPNWQEIYAGLQPKPEETKPDKQPEEKPADSGDSVEIQDAAQNEAAETEEVFSDYTPQRLSVAGAKPHPTPLVESSSMRAVKPPAVTYKPNLPKNLLETGALSLPQFESVVYAGQAHNEKLPSGERTGYFIGDGTGVGKGREISAIIIDNARQGRKKAIWISEKKGLIKNAQGDFADLDMPDIELQSLNDTKAKVGKVKMKNGVLFSTYSTMIGEFKNSNIPPEFAVGATVRLNDKDFPRFGEVATVTKAKTVAGVTEMELSNTARVKSSQVAPVTPAPVKTKARIDQIVEWFGPDYDGVIVFDESHNAKNAVTVQGDRGSQEPSSTGLAVVELQRRLPNARIVYASATGATEVYNLAYADRLGIWGPGTAFANKGNFFSKIAAAGLSAMEIVARDLKALGRYIARTLSFGPVDRSNPEDKGVEVAILEHALTPEQTETYDKIAQRWQDVYRNMQNVLESTGGSLNSRARANARGAFFSAQQRFFNQLLTATQIPTLLADMHKSLDAGEAVIIQLTNTNEATLDRALAKAQDEETPLEDLDLTPKDILMQYVDKSFPVQLYETYADENGNIRSRPVMDSEGKPVLDPVAIAERDRQLMEIRRLPVPENPLEQILNEFGHDKVAEVTGRGVRVVRKEVEGAMKTVTETRSESTRQVEAKEFIDDKRKILVFSQAGGTGFSYHSDKRFANQRRRIHYLVQAGWSADKAIQGLGRAHRSGQRVPPFLKLVRTNIEGHKRFISTIARRLSQLGALTSGERRATTRGLFTEADNLENQYADGAIVGLVRDSLRGEEPALPWNKFTEQMGFDNMLDPQGALKEDRIPSVPQFLNRVLILEVEDQNRVFGAFMARMERAIEHAKRTDTYDPGLQTLKVPKGGEILPIAEEEVYHHPGVDESTKIVEIEVVAPAYFAQFDAALRMAELNGEKDGKLVYSKNRRSGRVAVFKEANKQTDRTSGAMTDSWYRFGPKSTLDRTSGSEVDFTPAMPEAKVGDSFTIENDGNNGPFEIVSLPSKEKPYERVMVRKPGSTEPMTFTEAIYGSKNYSTGTSDLNNLATEAKLQVSGMTGAALAGKPGNFEEITREEAQSLWQKEIDDAEKFDRKRMHFITGLMLPIWDRTGIFSPQVFRVTAGKKTFLGVRIPEKQVHAVRRKLGASTNSITPEAAFKSVLTDDASYTLANDWKISRRRVSGQYRIEVSGLQWNDGENFTKYIGGFSERIGYDTRYFIPTDEASGVEAMTKLLKQSPVVDGGGTLSAASPRDGNFQDYDSLHRETQEDIAGWIAERADIPAVREYAIENWGAYEDGTPKQPLDISDVRNFLHGLVDPPVFKVENKPVSSITGFSRKTSDVAVKQYAAMKSEPPPILVDGDKFIDGGHRMQAAITAGRETIPTVDIGPLLRMDWKAWLEDKVSPDQPTRSNLTFSAAAPERTAAEAVETGAPGRPDSAEDRKAARAAVPAEKPAGVVQSIWDALKGVGSALKKWQGELAPYDTIDEAIGKWLGAGDSKPVPGTDIVVPGRQKAAHEARELTEAIQKQFPSLLTRQAISRYMEAGGDTALLREWADKSKPHMKPVYERALDLNPAEKAMADTATKFFAEKGEDAQKLGLLGNLLENYVTHFVERAPEAKRAGLMAQILGDLASNAPASKLKTKFDHAIKRVFRSMFELEQEGFSLRAGGDIAGTLGAYAQAANNTVADRIFVKSLTGIKARDGRPMAAPSGAITKLDEPAADSPLLIQPMKNPPDTSDFKPIPHRALRKWKWIGKEGDKDVMVEGELLIHPELYQRLKNTLGTSALNSVPAIRAIGEFQGVVKQLMLSFSAFHFVQEGTHAIGHRVNPFKLHEIDMEDATTRELVNAGLMLANWNARAEFGEGLTANGMEKLLGRIGLGKLGQLNDNLSAFLFERYIPGLKIEMAKHALERNLKRHKGELDAGKITRAQIAQRTAQQANDAFGEQNNLYAGHNPTRLHSERLLFLAPDFLKSRAKFFADIFTKYGREQLEAIVLLSVILAVSAKLLERMLTGKNDWEKPFSVVHGTRQYELRSVPGDVIHMLTNTRQFVVGRISPVISRTTMEAVTGRDWRGQKRTVGEQIKDAALTPLPLSVRGMVDSEAPDISTAEQIAGTMGLRTVRHSDITKARVLGHEWQAANGKEDAGEVHPPSKYRGLKNALEDGDSARAMKEYGKLLATMPKEKVDRGFHESLMKPFSGSHANEKAFAASLAGGDRATYQAAMTQRGRMLAAFNRMAATTRAPARLDKPAAKAPSRTSRELTASEFFK